MERLLEHWQDERARWTPYVVSYSGFVSCAHAQMVGRPDLAGTWQTADRGLRWGARDKRRSYHAEGGRSYVVLPLYRDGHDTADMDEWLAAQALRDEAFRDSGVVDWKRFRDTQGDWVEPSDQIIADGDVTLPHG
jgi:hypothetical protein